MTESQNRKPTGKDFALLILVAVIAAVAITLAQELALGKSHVAVTGGVVGAVIAVFAFRVVGKKQTGGT